MILSMFCTAKMSRIAFDKRLLRNSPFSTLERDKYKMKIKKSLINWLGLSGLVGFLFYAAAVIFAPLAYPGYDWMSRAVSDLSAENAPSLRLWNQLNNPAGAFIIVCITLVCVYISRKLNRQLRIGIYIFGVMQWVSAVGYGAFSLSDSGYTDAAHNSFDAINMMFSNFQDAMHAVVTFLVILLSIISLMFIIIGGYRKKRYVSLAVWATIALAMMMFGGIGVSIAPKEILGIVQRFSNFAAIGFNAVLGFYLFSEFKNYHGTADER